MDIALAKLTELRDKGFSFLQLHDDAGMIDRIFGFRQIRGFVDSILFWSETEARAGRIPAVRGIDQPAQAVWLFEGSVAEAVDRLLELPAPGTRNAPRLLRHTASELALAALLPFRPHLSPGAIA